MANMSFLPEDYLEKRTERRTNAICLTLFVVVLAAVVGAYLVTNQQRTEVRRQHLLINAQFDEAAKRLTQLEQLHQRKRDMIRKARVTAQLLERVPRTLLLSELINNMPQKLSLLNFELETKIIRVKQSAGKSALDAAKERKTLKKNDKKQEEKLITKHEVNLRLIGVAPTDVEVAKFMHALGECELFTDINLSFSEQVAIEEKSMRKFQIDMKLTPTVDVRQIEPKQVPRLKRNPMDRRLTAEAMLQP